MRRDLIPLWAVAAGIGVVVVLIWGRAPPHVPPLLAAFNACLEAAGLGFFPMLVGEGAMAWARRRRRPHPLRLGVTVGAFASILMWTGFIYASVALG